MSGEIKVYWGMTGYGPIWAPVYASHLCAVAFASRYFTVEFSEQIRACAQIASCGSTDRMYTHSAENRLVEEFLAVPEATHLFMTECDMILPHDVIPKLVALDKPVASGLYFLRGGQGQPCLYKKTITPANNPYPYSPVSIFPTRKPFRLNGCPGLGCVLITRAVFEALERPWFDLKERNGRGEGYGSDLYFFTHVNRLGVEVWVDPTVRCGQIDYKVESFEDYEERLATDPAFGQRGFIIGTPA